MEQKGQVRMDMPVHFRLSESDALYICGTTTGVERYHEEFSA